MLEELNQDGFNNRQLVMEVWNYVPAKEAGMHSEYTNCKCNPTFKIEDCTVKIFHNKIYDHLPKTETAHS
jgi:hypothetical protein